MLVKFLLAMIPVIWLLVGFSFLKLPGHKCCPIGLLLTFIVAMIFWKLPLLDTFTAGLEGAVMAIWPIGLIVIGAIFVYNLTIKTGGMDKIKQMLTSISPDKRVQVIIVGWCFGGFLEGIAGFGTSVAIPAGILVGLGFDPILACVVCLMSNVPVAVFGAVGIPTTTAAAVTGLSSAALAADTVIMLALLIVVCPIVMAAITGKLKGVFGIALISGVSFAVPAYFLGAYTGAELPCFIGSVVSLGCTIAAVKLFKHAPAPEYCMEAPSGSASGAPAMSFKEGFMAWVPFLLIFVFLFLCSTLVPPIHDVVASVKSGVHIYTGNPDSKYTFSWINTPGVLIILSGVIGGLLQGASFAEIAKVFVDSIKQMSKSLITIVSILSISKIMGYSGMIKDIALALVAITGGFYPVLAPWIGGIGTFITGSVTSSSSIFSGLQHEAATALNMDPLWLVAANGAGATVGKIISPQSVAIATAATGCIGADSEIIRKCLGYMIVFMLYLSAVCYFFA